MDKQLTLIRTTDSPLRGRVSKRPFCTINHINIVPSY